MKQTHSCILKIPFVIIILVLVLAMLCGSCSRDQKDEVKAPDNVASNLEDTSQFVAEVGKEKYEIVNPPSTAPVFRWDFSKADTVHTYLFEQESSMKTDLGSSFGDKPSGMGQKMGVKGLLLIKSQGNNTAELVLKDMKMKMEIPGEDEPRTMQQQMPPVVMQGLKEDGTGSFGNSSQDMLLKMLFPLLPETIEVGDSIEVPAQMPFNAMGSMLQVKGRFRITLTQYVKIGSRTCAQFDVETDISELNVPTDLEGEYKSSTRGVSVFYFDVAARIFVSGEIALIMQFSVDAPMPQVKMSGEDMPDMPDRSKMAMLNDTFISVTLKE